MYICWTLTNKYTWAPQALLKIKNISITPGSFHTLSQLFSLLTPPSATTVLIYSTTYLFACSAVSYTWNHVVCVLLNRCLLVIILILRLIVFVCIGTLFSFTVQVLLLSSIPLCGHTTLCLSSLAVHCFGLLEIKLP